MTHVINAAIVCPGFRFAYRYIPDLSGVWGLASHRGSATKTHSLRALEMLLRFDVARSPYQNESRLIALTAWRETFSEYARNLMLLCMFRIVGHPINS